MYALTDPRHSDVRYVGVTSKALGARLAWHLRQPTNSRTRAWFAELKAEGLRPGIMTIQRVNSQWERAEMEWIAWFRVRGDLLNVDGGGELVETGSGWDEIKREKMRAAMNSAEHGLATWDPPPCLVARPHNVHKKRGQSGSKKKKTKSTLRVQTIEPTIRRAKKPINLDSLRWGEQVQAKEIQEKKKTYGW